MRAKTSTISLGRWVVALGLLAFAQCAWAQGQIESPEPASVQSGVALIRGWVCQANIVEVELDSLPRITVPYRLPRGDTQGTCGDADNGFAALINWSGVQPGVHTLRVYADGVLFGQVGVVATSLGLGAFPRGLSGRFAIPSFPVVGRTVEIEWREAVQNFVLRGGSGSGGTEQQSASGRLENPEVGTIQSGVELIRGWVCTARVVEIELDSRPRLTVPYRLPRGDTQGACGDVDNGFAALMNWNEVAPGTHTLRAYADGVIFASVEFHVTSLGLGSFPKGLDKETTVANFPEAGKNAHVRWQENRQNFGLVGVLQPGQHANACGTQNSLLLDANGSKVSASVTNPCTLAGNILEVDLGSLEKPARLCASDFEITQQGQSFTIPEFDWLDGQGKTVTCRDVQPGRELPGLFIVKGDTPLNFNDPFQVTYRKTGAGNFSLTSPPRLTVQKTGAGRGTVTSIPAGIGCGLDCAQSYSPGTVVTVTATPATGSTFTGWAGDCTGTSPTTTVTLDAVRTCTATFDLGRVLTVELTGTGRGRVTTTPAGIDCPGTCTARYAVGTAVTFNITADEGSTYYEGSGCEDPITMDADRTCSYIFLRNPSLTIQIVGGGSVVASPLGLSCPGHCTERYSPNALVTLIAVPDPGRVFVEWGAYCSGTFLTATVTMLDTDLTCTATFQ